MLCGRALEESGARMKEEFPLDAAKSAALRRELKRRVTALCQPPNPGFSSALGP